MLRNKQWICKFIVLIILLAGMCVDKVNTDSVFVSPQTMVFMDSETVEAVLTEVKTESMELLCVRNSISSSQIATQITSARRTIKLSIVFLCVAVLSLLLSNFYTAERVVDYPRLRVRTAVLHYIHNTDGKK